MRFCFIGAVVFGLLACGGLVNDVSKGASSTDREVNKELGHGTEGPSRDRDAGRKGDERDADGGTISL